MYNLDLTDLPLDRLTEQKAKKRRGGKQQVGNGDQSRASFSSTGRRGSEMSSQGKTLSQLQCPVQPEDGSGSYTSPGRLILMFLFCISVSVQWQGVGCLYHMLGWIMWGVFHIVNITLTIDTRHQVQIH